VNRWWERFPDRYQFELTALDEAGLAYSIDEAAREQGRIVLQVDYVAASTTIKLQVHFPDVYPYFPFGVIAPDLALPHHQDPITKALCLLGTDTERWRPSLTVAQLLNEQIPKLLTISEPGYETGTVDELLDGEPVTAYMRDDPPFSHLGVGDWNLPAEAEGGNLLVGVHSRWPVRGAVLEVRDRADTVLATAASQIFDLYPASSGRMQGRWVRLSARPSTDDPEKIFAQMVERNSTFRMGQWQQSHKNTRLDIVGAVFADELALGKWADNWIFIAQRARTVPPRKAPIVTRHLLRTGRDSRADFAARVPELKPLRDKTVAVFGVGSLGSASALELARAGVRELRLIDRDIVEVGNTVRWAIGRPAAGISKSDAMHAFIAQHYPYTKVAPFCFNLGDPHRRVPEGVDPRKWLDGELLETILAGVDLVFDATAQQSVSYLLSALCWERKIPYVWVTTTPGAWGGIVGRAVAGVTEGCWWCFKAQQDHAIESPLFSGDPNVQPVGCVHSTFTGAALDINPISSAAVRLAVGTLCAGSDGGYPTGGWDIGVVNLRTPTGDVIPPTWNVYASKRHATCEHK
jgi:siroheme synthase (precorrin-2 oxidase/ferrochelatase)